MHRFAAIILAILLTSITVSSACVAAPSEWVHFTLEPENGGGRIKASFRGHDGDTNRTDWSASFLSSELVGLDPAGFRAPGTRPVRFSVIREAGRLDCGGEGGGGYAAGNCSFTPDPRFVQLLVNRGIGRPTRDQAFGLMALNVRRELIDAVAAAHYPTPTIGDLTAMTAVGVSGQYIANLARAGYRPRTTKSLVEFKALNITPDWIAGFARIGYADLPADQLMQLKALNVTPDFIVGYERIGYRNMPVDQLVQLKALDITPDFVRTRVAAGRPLPSITDLVEMKVFHGLH